MILIITGNGKGKTTSALGTAIRATGWGKQVAIVFFDKGGNHYGEQNILNILQSSKSDPIHLDIFRFGNERFSEKSHKFRFENTKDDKKEAESALQKVRNLYNKEYFLVIADEIINCLNLDLLDELAVRDLINELPKNTHLILTGRNTPDWLIEKADLVSEINEVKHYFTNGEDAIKGLDY